MKTKKLTKKEKEAEALVVAENATPKRETQIFKMLEFLASKQGSFVQRRSHDGVFETGGGEILIDNEDFRVRDNQSVTIDFDKKTISWYAAYESGHNGSDFGKVVGFESWSTLENSFERLSSVTRAFMKFDAMEDEKKKKQDLLDLQVYAKWTQVIGD